MTPESENPNGEQDKMAAAKEKLAKAGETRAEQAAAQEARANWKPTPTTEECDLVAMGASVDEVGHADDGSGPDPHQTRAMWPAKRPSDDGYETR